MLSCLCFCSLCSAVIASIQIVPTQETNRPTVAPLVLPMDPPLSLESLGFLFIKQNLSRVPTVDQSGPMVKAHITYTRLRYSTELARLNILIRSSPFLLPRLSLLARPKAHTHQGPRGACPLPVVKRCLDTRPRIP